MTSASPAKKFVQMVRLLVQQIERTRLGAAVLSGVKATATSFARVLHVLWLEVTGFIFLCLGLMGLLAVLREYHNYAALGASSNKLVVAALFTILFAYFGISSFWRARRRRT